MQLSGYDGYELVESYHDTDLLYRRQRRRRYLYYKNKNWLQFLFIVKAAVLKQQISKLYPQIQRTEVAITFISVSGLS